uniref:Uncharacterized protein n=1 Tax=Rangifer tarandus platyrhynchus TaxID=3082113 RepID=A0ACB0ELP3_RANTA|nr:unnamed protein product [Rangifer tarandus platyrhynchus]
MQFLGQRVPLTLWGQRPSHALAFALSRGPACTSQNVPTGTIQEGFAASSQEDQVRGRGLGPEISLREVTGGGKERLPCPIRNRVVVERVWLVEVPSQAVPSGAVLLLLRSPGRKLTLLAHPSGRG